MLAEILYETGETITGFDKDGNPYITEQNLQKTLLMISIPFWMKIKYPLILSNSLL